MASSEWNPGGLGIRVIQPTPGVSRYIVFVPEAGTGTIGTVERCGDGRWTATHRGGQVSPALHWRRRDAVADVVMRWSEQRAS